MKDYSVCKNCWYRSFCHDNDNCNFDPENKNCPNYEEGMKNYE